MDRLLIFLSSTTEDLGTIRARIAEALHLKPAWKALNQENFGAHPNPPEEYCASLVKQADLFVGIIGHRRGSLADGERSFVEMECDVAEKEGKPRLIFLADDGLRARASDQDPRAAERQRRFRDALQASGVTTQDFSAWEELPAIVSMAVQGWWEQQPRSWAPDLPLPPEPFHKPPYGGVSSFNGRVAQRLDLSRWFTAGHETVYGLIGGPGMGKSALAWVWLLRDVQGTSPPGYEGRVEDAPAAAVPPVLRPRGVIRWSFDDDARGLLDGARPFQVFLRDALHYVSEGEEGWKNELSETRCLEMLVDVLTRERYLLVLDGFERELSGFQAPDVEQQGASQSWKNPLWRECTDPVAREFLRRVASVSMASRILLCSRVRPKDLEMDGDVLRAFCRSETLPGLTPEEAGSLLSAQDLPEIATSPRTVGLCERLGGSPLGLILAARSLRHYRQEHGAPDLSQVQPGRLSREGELQRAFAGSFDALPTDHQSVLGVVAAFRGPVERAILDGVVDWIPEDQLDDHLRWLTGHPELLLLSSKHYDMHPLVRHFVRGRTPDFEDVHRRIADHLAIRFDVKLREQYDEPGRTGGRVSRDELSQHVELFHHLLRGGRRVQALVLFAGQVWEPLLYGNGDLGLMQELLIEAFPRFRSPETILTEDAHQGEAFGLNQLANCFRMGGRVVPAVLLHRAVVDWDRRVGRPDLQAIRQELLGVALMHVGDYAAARENLDEALQLSRRHAGSGALEDNSNRAACLRDLGRLHIRAGRFEEALEALESSRELASQEDSAARKELTPTLALRALAELQSGEDPREALTWARKALAADSGEWGPVARHGAEAQAILAMAATAAGELGVAREAVEEALRASWELNHRRIEMMALIAAARLALAQGDADVALEKARLAARFAGDGGYVPLEGEARLLAAEGHQRRGEVEEAVEAARRARELSRSRLDPRTERLRETERKPGLYDAPLYRQAEALLAELGAAG